MAAKIIDGKALASKLKGDLQVEVTRLVGTYGRGPGLAVILVGEDPASHVYVKNKEIACNKVGITSFPYKLPASTTQQHLLGLIAELNNDPKVDGILVQLPLPEHIDSDKVLNAIKADKDVDGFHPTNFGKMALDMSTFIPATPFGILELLERYGVETKGKHAVVIGRSHIVGRPMSILMGRKAFPGNSTVTLTHSHTKNIEDITRQADIIITALGIPEFLKADMVKDGVVVIDVGITRIPDESKSRGYRITGDVDFENVSKKASFITPVPGGVGPMTIAMLLKNTLQASKARKG